MAVQQTTPAGINPIDYLNYLARLQAYQNQTSQRASQQQNDLMMQLINEANAKQQEAYNANDERRNQILQGRTDTRNRILDQWNEFGDSLINDTNRGYQRNLDNSLAALNDTGLLHSSVNASVRRQNERDRQDSMRRVKDQIVGNYANADERLSNEIDAFNERIVDHYPDTGGLAGLAAQAGSVIPSGGGAYASGTRRFGARSRGLGSGGGGYSSLPAVPQLHAPATPTPSLAAMRQADSLKSQGSNMAALFSATHPAAGTRDDPISQQLYNMLLNGTGQWNPNPGTPTVPVFPFQTATAPGTGGNMAQQQARPPYGSNPFYRSRQMRLDEQYDQGREKATVKNLQGDLLSGLSLLPVPGGTTTTSVKTGPVTNPTWDATMNPFGMASAFPFPGNPWQVSNVSNTPLKSAGGGYNLSDLLNQLRSFLPGI